VTYADTSQVYEVFPLRWNADASNFIWWRINTSGANTGSAGFVQNEGGTVDAVNGVFNDYSPGLNVPFNLAARHGSTFINGAIDGAARTENTTPTALADLSGTDMQVPYTPYNGTLRKFRMWDTDLGDTGIEEATS